MIWILNKTVRNTLWSLAASTEYCDVPSLQWLELSRSRSFTKVATITLIEAHNVTVTSISFITSVTTVIQPIIESTTLSTTTQSQPLPSQVTRTAIVPAVTTP